jgi:5'-3' exonuclease
MGIPYYFYVITQAYPGILQKVCPKNVERFYLDYNGGVHPVCQRLFKDPEFENSTNVPGPTFEKKLIEESWNYMISLVREANPKNVHIALDGVAPIAKIQQQRKRRYLSILRQKMLKQKLPWDTNAISPGTVFMSDLNAYFKNRIKSTFSAIPLNFTGSDEVGEGEHKIFHHIREHVNNGEVSMVYGLDADLIMLSLLSHKPAIHLMREQQHIKKGEEGFVYLDIDALRKGILQNLVQTHRWPITQQALDNPFDHEAKSVINNYVTACFMLGNDFLPHISSLHLKKDGLTHILTSFQQTWSDHGSPLLTMPGTGDIGLELLDSKFFMKWMENLAQNEDDVIWTLTEEYVKKRCMIRQAEDVVEFYPIQAENKDPFAFELLKLASKGRWRSLYYKFLFDSKMNDTSVTISACAEFIKGILWTYRYYTLQPKPSDWYYPYGYAPTIKDLANHVSGDVKAYDNLQEAWNKLEGTKLSSWLHPLVQLSSILPHESHTLLPVAVQKALKDPSNGVRYMFPTEYKLKTYMKTHLWECHPILPVMDFKALSSVVLPLL